MNITTRGKRAIVADDQQAISWLALRNWVAGEAFSVRRWCNLAAIRP